MPTSDLREAYQRLIDRLKLRQYTTEELRLSPLITPTVPIIEQGSIRYTMQSVDQDLSGGATDYPFVVPADERWLIAFLYVATTASNHRSVVRVGGTAVRIGPAETAETRIQINAPFWLEPGDAVGADETGNAGDTSIRMQVLYGVEKILRQP